MADRRPVVGGPATSAAFDSGATPAQRMRAHARDNDHLYGHLMRAMADDWEAGGPVREIYRGWENAPAGSVIQLRLLAGIFRIVLTDRAPELVRFYPCLGGEDPPDEAWPAIRGVLARHVDELHDALDVAPQTNEVGRSNALLVGLFDAVGRSGLRRIRLLEPGASAGLNLLVDEFRFVNPGWSFGPEDSPLVLRGAVLGDVHPEEFVIVSRRGCDVSPVDPATPEGQLRLKSFVWPFHVERHERLAAALQVAGQHPVEVDQANAGEWLEHQLAEPMADDVLTVVWQSITRMYWPVEETARVDELIAAARERTTVAHLAMEYPPDFAGPGAVLTNNGVHLATVGDHGTPVTVLEAERE